MTSYPCTTCHKTFTQKLHICKGSHSIPSTPVSQKQTLGQFFTTNYSHILQGISVPFNTKHIIEPFAGNCDLLRFIDESQYTIECYDIDPKQSRVTQRDTINDPPSYKDKFLITNPPYLARNKAKDKTLFDKYKVNDLYKCLMKELLTNQCTGGILIIPLNFWSSIRKADIELRKAFLSHYSILQLNIFEEQVFDDTTSTVCCFLFTQGLADVIPITIFPSRVEITTVLNVANNFSVGGEIYNLPVKGSYKIGRWTSKNKDCEGRCNILAKCIDDNSNSMIGLSVVSDEELYLDTTSNCTARTYATLVITPELSMEVQEIVVEKFNEYLSNQRRRYHSLFLTNFRESKDIARKRISFDLVYRIVGYVLERV